MNESIQKRKMTKEEMKEYAQQRAAFFLSEAQKEIEERTKTNSPIFNSPERKSKESIKKSNLSPNTEKVLSNMNDAYFGKLGGNRNIIIPPNGDYIKNILKLKKTSIGKTITKSRKIKSRKTKSRKIKSRKTKSRKTKSRKTKSRKIKSRKMKKTKSKK